jgi:hypothetical protein
MLELVRTFHVALPVRGGLVGAGAGVVILACFSMLLRDRGLQWFGVLFEALSAVAAIAGGYAAAGKPHTRALAGVLFAFAFAAVARLGAFMMVDAAGERASLQLFALSRGLATAGVLLEAMGQLVAVTWLGTRSKLAGQVGATLALVVALVLTYGVARGVHAEASLWQSVLHTALADAPGVPPPRWAGRAGDLPRAGLAPAGARRLDPAEPGRGHRRGGGARARLARCVRRAAARALHRGGGPLGRPRLHRRASDVAHARRRPAAQAGGARRLRRP